MTFTEFKKDEIYKNAKKRLYTYKGYGINTYLVENIFNKNVHDHLIVVGFANHNGTIEIDLIDD